MVKSALKGDVAKAADVQRLFLAYELPHFMSAHRPRVCIGHYRRSCG
jgi:hypothetical protein